MHKHRTDCSDWAVRLNHELWQTALNSRIKYLRFGRTPMAIVVNFDVCLLGHHVRMYTVCACGNDDITVTGVCINLFMQLSTRRVQPSKTQPEYILLPKWRLGAIFWYLVCDALVHNGRKGCWVAPYHRELEKLEKQKCMPLLLIYRLPLLLTCLHDRKSFIIIEIRTPPHGKVETPCKQSIAKVIKIESYRPNTHTHDRRPTDCVTWPPNQTQIVL